jgi:hypothetical protein
MMIVTQPVAITLSAAEWLQIAGWLIGQPTRPGVTDRLLGSISQVVLKDGA